MRERGTCQQCERKEHLSPIVHLNATMKMSSLLVMNVFEEEYAPVARVVSGDRSCGVISELKWLSQLPFLNLLETSPGKNN